MVAGFYIEYEVHIQHCTFVFLALWIYYIFVHKPIGLKRVAVRGSVNVTSGMSSVNISNLEEGTRYDITISPYIGGFQLGPPTSIIINTSPLGKLGLHAFVTFPFWL